MQYKLEDGGGSRAWHFGIARVGTELGENWQCKWTHSADKVKQTIKMEL